MKKSPWRRRALNASLVAVIVGIYLWWANTPRYDLEAERRVDEVRRSLLDPFDGRILVCAHRCGRRPENSLSAIELAIALRADIVEVDTAETADGQIVLMHDRTVDDTTGGVGPIAKMTLAQVRALDLDGSMTGEGPPTLAEALRVAGEDVFVNLDMKKGAPAKIVQIVRDARALHRVIFYGNDRVLKAVLELEPRAIIMSRIRRLEDVDSVLARFHPPLLQVPAALMTPELALRLRQAGAKPWVNSIGWRDWVSILNLSVSYMSLCVHGVGVIQTDAPERVRAFLDRHDWGVQADGRMPTASAGRGRAPSHGPGRAPLPALKLKAADTRGLPKH